MNDRTYRWKSRRAQIDRSQVSLKEEGETSNIEVLQNTQRMALGSGRARIIGDLSKCHFSGGGEWKPVEDEDMQTVSVVLEELR